MAPDEMEKRLISVEAQLKRTTERLRVMEDIEAIKQMHMSYVNSVCFAEFENISEFFAEDSTIDFGALEAKDPPIKGKVEIGKFFKEKVAKVHVGKEATFVVHPIIKVNGDSATGNWVLYIMYSFPRTGQALCWVQLTYEARYVREEGKWKFGYLFTRERLGLPGGGAPLEIFGLTELP